MDSVKQLASALEADAKAHTPEGMTPRIYGAQYDGPKPTAYKGTIVAIQDGFALQRLNGRGSFAMHPVDGFDDPGALAVGQSLQVKYDQGRRVVEPWEQTTPAREPRPRRASTHDAKTAPDPGQDKKSQAPGKEAEGKEPKKTMADIDNDKYRAVADRIVKAIESGNSIWQKPWKQAAAQNRPHNAESTLNYRGINRVLLMHEMMARGSNDTRFMTFNQCRAMAERMKREGVPEDKLPHVRKGAESIEIVKYGRTERKQAVLDDDGTPKKDADGKPIMKTVQGRAFLQSHRVFHASDIENMPPLVLMDKKADWEIHAQAEDLVKALGVPVRHEADDRAFYTPSRDTITMPEQVQFKSANDYYATLMHEAGHATGHASRLNRPGIVDFSGFGSPSYAYEELVADTASAFTCSELGLDSEAVVSNHASYLKGWARSIQADPKILFKAFNEAEQAADWVMQRHEKQHAHVPTPEAEPTMTPAVDYTATLNHAEPIRPANTHRAPEPALSM